MVIVKAFGYKMTRMTVLSELAVLRATLGHGIRMIRIETSLTLLRKTNFLLLFRVPVPGHHFGEIRAVA